MKRTIGFLAGAITLAGCAHPSPMPGPSRQCRAAGLERFAGQVRSPRLADRIKADSGARVIRWVPPGTMVTMDYRADRVTVSLDEASRVTRVSCG